MTTTHRQGARGAVGEGFPEGGPVAAGGQGAQPPSARPPGAARPQRPLALTGAIAACAAASAGLATLTLVAAIAWIAAVHIGLGAGLPGVLRTAIQLWLVGHHVGFDLHAAGKIGLLPLGLVLVPGALLWRAGRWVVRSGGVQRLRHVGYAALALALPYGLLTGALAVASRTAASAPSPMEAAVAGFLLAFAAGGLGGARALAPWARLIGLLPDRARCLVVGITGSLAVLAGAGALLTGASLVAHQHDFSLASDALSPGLLGSALLLLAALCYLPNAIIWAMAYMLGPGFAFGVGTIVAPTGTLLGPLPVFPMLTALPAGSAGPHPAPPAWTGLAMLAVPYLAGMFGGLLTVRTAPTPTVEAAPLWGFASGVLAGGVVGALAAFSGGSLGTGRLAATGPVAWQVGLVAALELGIAAAISAGLANWLLLRRISAAAAAAGQDPLEPGGDADDHRADDHRADDHRADDHRADDHRAEHGAVVLVDDVVAMDSTVAMESTVVEGAVVAEGAITEGAGAAESGGVAEDTGVALDAVVMDAVVVLNGVDDAGEEGVALLGPVTAEDLASLAGSPGADTPLLPALPVTGIADELGYLPEPPELADADDAELDGPPEPRPAPAGQAADHTAPQDLPAVLATLARLGKPVPPADDLDQPTGKSTVADELGEPSVSANSADETESAYKAELLDAAVPVGDAGPADAVAPTDDAGRADAAVPVDDAGPAVGAGRADGAGPVDAAVPVDDAGPAVSAVPAIGVGPAGGAGPADDTESADDTEPADEAAPETALAHVIHLRPRDRGRQEQDPKQHPDPGRVPDNTSDDGRQSAGDAKPGSAHGPGQEPGADGLTGRARPAAPGLPLS